MKALLSILIFATAYFFIATEKINKTVVAMIGASLVIFFKLISFERAIGAVDFNVVFLLVGMMTSVYILSRTGFFEWMAISVAKKAKGDPWRIMVFLLAVTAVLSAFLDNVTTIIMIVPVTILIMQLLEISPVPFIIMEVIVSNISGTSTLIGDPPNIIIGSQAGLSFNSFLLNLGPAVIFVLLAFLATIFLIFRNKFQVEDRIKKRLIGAIPHLAIVDGKNMVKALWVLGLIFAGFFLHEVLNLQPGIIALGGSMLMLLVCNSESEDTLMKVEWGVIFFFIGMFMMVAALEDNGVIGWLGNNVIGLAGGNLFVVCIMVLWGTAIFSSLLDNIPFVITMVPMVKTFVDYFTQASGLTDSALISTQIAHPLWWSLALGACLGGNGTIIGASSNIVMARIAEKNNYPISFGRFFKYGMFFMVQSMLICTLYIWLRYFYG